MSHRHGNHNARRPTVSGNGVHRSSSLLVSSNDSTSGLPPPPYDGPYHQSTSANRSPAIIRYPNAHSEREPLLPNSSSPSRAGESRESAQELSSKPTMLSRLLKLLLITAICCLAFLAGHIKAEYSLQSAWEELRQEKQTWTDERRTREAEEKRDVERRQRARLVWVNVEHEETCLAYGMRNYQARLENVPYGVDAMKWCSETPFEIYGVTYEKPKKCSVRLSQSFYCSSISLTGQ
jgi:hypothetical protein